MFSEDEKREILAQAAALNKDFAEIERHGQRRPMTLDVYIQFLSTFSKAWSGGGTPRPTRNFSEFLI